MATLIVQLHSLHHFQFRLCLNKSLCTLFRLAAPLLTLATVGNLWINQIVIRFCTNSFKRDWIFGKIMSHYGLMFKINNYAVCEVKLVKQKIVKIL